MKMEIMPNVANRKRSNTTTKELTLISFSALNENKVHIQGSFSVSLKRLLMFRVTKAGAVVENLCMKLQKIATLKSGEINCVIASYTLNN